MQNLKLTLWRLYYEITFFVDTQIILIDIHTLHGSVSDIVKVVLIFHEF